MRVLTYSSVRPCVSEISAESGLSVIGRAADDVTGAAALALSPGSGPGAAGVRKPTHALQSGHNSTLHTGHAAQPTGYTRVMQMHMHTGTDAALFLKEQFTQKIKLMLF